MRQAAITGVPTVRYHTAARARDHSIRRCKPKNGHTDAAGSAAVVESSARDTAAAAVAGAVADVFFQHDRQHVTIADLCMQERQGLCV